jgi:hypothetical protein
MDGPVDLEQLIAQIPAPLLETVRIAARAAWAVGGVTRLARAARRSRG